MAETDSNIAVTAFPRRRFRLHRSTWTVAVLILVVAVFIVVPGEPGRYPDQRSWRRTPAIVHGWPLHFLWRTPVGWENDPAQSPPAIAWELTDSVRQFRWLPLGADVVVATAGIVTVVLLVEWRRRSRRRFLQFTLRELLVFVTVISVGLGWWGIRRKASRELKEHLSRIPEKAWGLEPDFPLWLRTLDAHESLQQLDLTRHVDPGVLWWNLSHGDDIRYVVERFPKETTLIAFEAISDDDVAAISAIDRLESFVCGRQASLSQALAILDNLRNLRRLELGQIDEWPIDDASMAWIGKLSRLDYLKIGNASQLTERGLAELGNLKELKVLTLGKAKLTKEAFHRLGDLTQLRVLDLWKSTISEPDLAQLDRIKGLEELGLGDTNLGDEGASHLRALRELRYLNLGWTHVTNIGVNAMFVPSADCPRPLDSLTYLDFQDCACDLAAVDQLSTLPNLEGLRVAARQVNSAAIAAFKKLPHLCRLDLTGLGMNGLPMTGSPLQAQLEQALPSCQVDVR